MNEKYIPELVQKRIKLAALFYPIERKLQRRLAKSLISGFEQTVEYFDDLAGTMNYNQSIIGENLILWKDITTKKTECLFCLITDITEIESIPHLFELIKKHSPAFSYAFVHQKKDGDGVFDIFRFSHFSYLEHCNRVKYP